MRSRFTAQGVQALQAAAVATEGQYLIVPMDAYERISREHRRPMPVPADYEPRRDWQDGRCCT